MFCLYASSIFVGDDLVLGGCMLEVVCLRFDTLFAVHWMRCWAKARWNTLFDGCDAWGFDSWPQHFHILDGHICI